MRSAPQKHSLCPGGRLAGLQPPPPSIASPCAPLPSPRAAFVCVSAFFLSSVRYATNALVSLVLAEVATNVHSFIVIATNHAGDDLYRFNVHCKPHSGTFFLRQVFKPNALDPSPQEPNAPPPPPPPPCCAVWLFGISRSEISVIKARVEGAISPRKAPPPPLTPRQGQNCTH